MDPLVKYHIILLYISSNTNKIDKLWSEVLETQKNILLIIMCKIKKEENEKTLIDCHIFKVWLKFFCIFKILMG